MTVKEAIDRARELYPNAFGIPVLLEWLNECEGLIQTRVINIWLMDRVKHEWEHTERIKGAVFKEHGICPGQLTRFRPGEKIEISGCVTEANNKSATVLKLNHNHTELETEESFTPGTENGEITLKSERYNDKLLLDFPFDKLYPQYIGAKIDLANKEYGKYNNSMEVFNASFEEFAKWFVRTYNPSRRVL